MRLSLCSVYMGSSVTKPKRQILFVYVYMRKACCLRRGITTPGPWHRDPRSESDINPTSAVEFPGALSGRDHDPTPANCRRRHAMPAEYNRGIYLGDQHRTSRWRVPGQREAPCARGTLLKTANTKGARALIN